MRPDIITWEVLGEGSNNQMKKLQMVHFFGGFFFCFCYSYYKWLPFIFSIQKAQLSVHFHIHRYILDITASALYIRKLRFKNLNKFVLDPHLKNTEVKFEFKLFNRDGVGGRGAPG